MAIYPKPSHQLLYSPMTGEMKCPIGYTFALRIPFHLLQCQCNTCTNKINNDMIHFISSCVLIGSSILTSLALHRCNGPSAPSLCSSIPPRGLALQSLWLALHSCNRSIKPSLIFSTLVTWLHFMSYMQWAPSLHIHLWTNLLFFIRATICKMSHFMTPWLHVMSHMQWSPSLHIHLWTNLLCILT
jgi:hypothetical protein